MELTVVVIYLVGMIAIGLYYAGKIKTTEDFSLAGRSVPWFLAMATLLATSAGGGASVGSVGRAYAIGAAWPFIVSGWYVCHILVGIFLAPRLARYNFYTVADFMEYRYGEFARVLTAILCLAYVVGVNAAQLVAMGTITASILGIPLWVALLVATAVIVFYSCAGGLKAVIQTDLIQAMILIGGFALALFLGLRAAGGYAALAASPSGNLLSPTAVLAAPQIVALFFAFLLGEGLSPMYVQRYYAGRTPDDARRGSILAGVVLLLVMPIATTSLGIMAAGKFPGLKEGAVFMTVVREVLPAALSGVFIAAVLAAIMSTADSMLQVAGVIVMRDFWVKFRPAAGDRELLAVSRYSIVVIAVLGLCLGLYLPSVMGLLLYSYSVWAPAIILPFVVGLLWYRESLVYSVVTSMVAGLIAAFIWIGLGQPHGLEGSVFGVVVGLAAFFVAIPLTRHLAPAKGFAPRIPGGREVATR